MAKDNEAQIVSKKIKYVKKAKMWVKSTFFEYSDGKRKQKEEWSIEKPVGLD